MKKNIGCSDEIVVMREYIKIFRSMTKKNGWDMDAVSFTHYGSDGQISKIVNPLRVNGRCISLRRAYRLYGKDKVGNWAQSALEMYKSHCDSYYTVSTSVKRGLFTRKSESQCYGILTCKPYEYVRRMLGSNCEVCRYQYDDRYRSCFPASVRIM